MKGDRGWRCFLAERGIGLRGLPIPGHHPRGFVSPREFEPRIIFYDNSVPRSIQDTSIAHEFAHLYLDHNPSGLTDGNEPWQEVEAEIVAGVLTYGSYPPNYFTENPEIFANLVMAGATGAGYAIYRLIKWLYESRKNQKVRALHTGF